MRQIAVIGLGNFGSTVARELTDRGVQVLAIDSEKERIDLIKECVSTAVAADTTDEKALKAIGVQNVDIAVVCIGENVEANLLTTILLKKIGVKKIWARAISPLQHEIIKSLAVDNIINLEEEMGKITANSLIAPNISRFISLMPGHSFMEIKVPAPIVGKSIQELHPRRKFKINIVAIKKSRPQINSLGERTFEEYIEEVPSSEEPLAESDVLLLVGKDEDLQKFAKQ
ncbi:MAG: TrkA family potassium uptake protein [Candidatus Margulisbacteria bacterium]|nr:TrkA family potassium uptake protein [Candidatus Margulisiibacteriota bacterium]MBU1617521.1 TrkA family potassium uptake protein [Candidatus Margulisiibacteriota bacterium]